MGLQISKNAWSIMVVATLLVIGGVIYYSFGMCEHVSKGQFVGPGKCKKCHEEQYDSWKKTRMANSFDM